MKHQHQTLSLTQMIQVMKKGVMLKELQAGPRIKRNMPKLPRKRKVMLRKQMKKLKKMKSLRNQCASITETTDLNMESKEMDVATPTPKDVTKCGKEKEDVTTTTANSSMEDSATDPRRAKFVSKRTAHTSTQKTQGEQPQSLLSLLK